MNEKQANNNVASTADAPKLLASDAIAIYDPRDGRVLHLHHSLVFEGGRRAEPESLKRAALERARALGCPVDGLATLHVPNFVPGMGPVVVDVARGTLVALPLPASVRARLQR